MWRRHQNTAISRTRQTMSDFPEQFQFGQNSLHTGEKKPL